MEHRINSICIIRILEREEKELAESIFKTIMTEHFLNLGVKTDI